MYILCVFMNIIMCKYIYICMGASYPSHLSVFAYIYIFIYMHPPYLYIYMYWSPSGSPGSREPP